MDFMRRRRSVVSGKWKYHHYFNRSYRPLADVYACELYLGSLPVNFSISECLQLLNTHGRIAEINLYLGKCHFNEKKGYAFVRYSDPIEAEKASINLDGLEIRNGLHLRAVLSRCQRRLLVINIPFDKSDEEILETLSSELTNIVDVKSMKPLKRLAHLDTRRNTGSAVLEFRTHGAAVKALRMLTSGLLHFWGKSLIASWMDPKKLYKHVMMTGLPWGISNRNLLRWLQKLSKDGVVKFLWRDRWLHLEFCTNYQAELVVQEMKGKTFNDGSVVRVEWNVLA